MKWDKKVEKHQTKITNKLDKVVQKSNSKSKNNTGKAIKKIEDLIANNPEVKKYQQIIRENQNRRALNIDEVIAQNKQYDKAWTARNKIVYEHRIEITEAALKDIGYIPTKQSARKYTDRLNKKHS